MTEYHFTFKLADIKFVEETWGILLLLELSFSQFEVKVKLCLSLINTISIIRH